MAGKQFVTKPPGTVLFGVYRMLTGMAAPALGMLLSRRLALGKEMPERINEKRGVPRYGLTGKGFIWVHAASVGEVQSALILISHLSETYPQKRLLVTTGTVTSARIVEGKLPNGAIHQFYPLDQPKWVARFLDHWRPSLVFWMESELWPNMLDQLWARGISAVLVNARMSPRSYNAWGWARPLAQRTLNAFSLILAQTEEDCARFKGLGYEGKIVVTDNLKYSALPLPYSEEALTVLQEATRGRVLWVYASTHKGEEEIAARVHGTLKARFPSLLTIIVPRHPERREQIADSLTSYGLSLRFRGEAGVLPLKGDDLYIADTLGELGLFYRLASVACIGRSMSEDGGGGHNPLEAAQLGCAVLHGPHIQNLQQIFDDMDSAGAATKVGGEKELSETLAGLFESTILLQELQKAGHAFAEGKAGVIHRVIDEIQPLLDQASLQKQERMETGQ